jgi:nucleotide-binding universal stress UspA family protein
VNHECICVAVALQRYLDFTPVALRQRDLAQLISRGTGAKILLLSVEAPVELLPGLETTGEKLERFAKPLRDQGIEVVTELRTGRPSQEIVEALEASGTDLLIMGSHSKRGPLDVGLGSTVKALPSDLDVPVLLVRPTVNETARAHELIIPPYPMVFPYG